ncbi:hypothetical protein D9M68_642400 [compost metagenome]
MALHKSTEANQRHTVLAVQCPGDFFQYGVEYTISLIFGQIRLVGDGGGEFRFTHKCPFDGLLLLCPCCSSRTAPKAPQQLYSAADLRENGMGCGPAPVLPGSLTGQIKGVYARTTDIHASSAGNCLFSASFFCTAVPVKA